MIIFTLSIELLLHSFKSCIKFSIVELVGYLAVVFRIHCEYSVDQSFFIFVKLDTILLKMREEEPFAESYSSLLATARFAPLSIISIVSNLLVQVSQLIEELIAIYCQLIDDLLKNRLNLHEGIETPTGLSVHDVLDGLNNFNNRDLSCVFIVKELH